MSSFYSTLHELYLNFTLISHGELLRLRTVQFFDLHSTPKIIPFILTLTAICLYYSFVYIDQALMTL